MSYSARKDAIDGLGRAPERAIGVRNVCRDWSGPGIIAAADGKTG